MAKIFNLSISRLQIAVIALVVIAVTGLSIWGIDRIMRQQAMNETAALAQNDAKILSAGLQSELDKFNLVPLVLAEDPQVQALFAGQASQQAVLNKRLELLAKQTKASAIYIMDDKGMTLAASNWRLPTSFVGSNYSFRRYFSSAMSDGSATQFALGTVSRRPGLYIAQRVGTDQAPSGIVAVKVEFDDLEASWREANQGVYVTDRDGVVLIASDDSWRFHSVNPDNIQERDEVADKQQFGVKSIQPLSLQSGNSSSQLLSTSLLDAEETIALDSWVLHLVVDPSSKVNTAIANGRLLLLLIMALSMLFIGWWLYMRRRREMAADQIIAQRTQKLREQLTQANRLATLGQIAAGVAHEINQPLAAARVFAENGELLIARGDTAGATENFAKIASLSHRIGRITDELRHFSRRQASEPKSMPIGQAIDGTLLLLRDRVASLNVSIDLPDPEKVLVKVRAEHVRLEQVLVNLVQNALDATGVAGHIVIDIKTDQRSCFLTVSDNGAGIDRDLVDKLFQPFATTKKEGLGLGLVISRDIMRDLGGDLTADTHTGGARFTMKVPRI